MQADRLTMELDIRATLDTFGAMLPPEDRAAVREKGPEVAAALAELAEQHGAANVARLIEIIGRSQM